MPDRLGARLDEMLYPELTHLGRGTADAVHDRINLEALADGIKRRVGTNCAIRDVGNPFMPSGS
jgi:hypothetical protein